MGEVTLSSRCDQWVELFQSFVFLFPVEHDGRTTSSIHTYIYIDSASH